MSSYGAGISPDCLFLDSLLLMQHALNVGDAWPILSDCGTGAVHASLLAVACSGPPLGSGFGCFCLSQPLGLGTDYLWELVRDVFWPSCLWCAYIYLEAYFSRDP
jgi:hypothetical protein